MRKPSLAFWNTLLWLGLIGVFIAAFGVLAISGQKNLHTEQHQAHRAVLPLTHVGIPPFK